MRCFFFVYRRRVEEEDIEREKKREEKLRRREVRRTDREERRRQEKLKLKRQEEEEKMQARIALEERKILIAQRKLETIRLLSDLFNRIKVINAQTCLNKCVLRLGFDLMHLAQSVACLLFSDSSHSLRRDF